MNEKLQNLKNLNYQNKLVKNKYAWATVFSKPEYEICVFRLYQLLQYYNSKYPFEILVTDNLTPADLPILTKNNVPYKVVPLLQFCKNGQFNDGRYIDTLSKFNIFTLTQYEQVCFLDSDMLITKNIDHIFDNLVDPTKEYNFVSYRNIRRFDGCAICVKPSMEKYEKWILDIHKEGKRIRYQNFANDEDILKSLDDSDIHILFTIDDYENIGILHFAGHPKIWKLFKPNTNPYNWFYNSTITQFINYLTINKNILMRLISDNSLVEEL